MPASSSTQPQLMEEPSLASVVTVWMPVVRLYPSTPSPSQITT